MPASTLCFITATDTDAGKSFVTTLLWRQLQQQGADVVALKPVACGVEGDGINSDVALLQRLQPQQVINLHTTPQPLAPLFDQHVEPEKLLLWCQQRAQHQRITLMEGVGGLMVPLAKGFTQLDWVVAMPDALIVLVVPARLGCLSQVLVHLSLLEPVNRHRLRLVVNCITPADIHFAEQCVQTADQWFPWIQCELLTPDNHQLPALLTWLQRDNC